LQASIFISLLALVVLVWGVQRYRGKARRNRLFQTSLSSDKISILEVNVPLYTRLPKELCETLHGCINYFLDEKVFVGCDDLVITDEMRFVIAANACMLVVNRDKKYFPGFETILVYPDTYVASVGRQTVCNLLSFSLPRFTFSRMSLADLVQT
jgi:hypothetical protein